MQQGTVIGVRLKGGSCDCLCVQVNEAKARVTGKWILCLFSCGCERRKGLCGTECCCLTPGGFCDCGKHLSDTGTVVRLKVNSFTIYLCR